LYLKFGIYFLGNALSLITEERKDPQPKEFYP